MEGGLKNITPNQVDNSSMQAQFIPNWADNSSVNRSNSLCCYLPKKMRSEPMQRKKLVNELCVLCTGSVQPCSSRGWCGWRILNTLSMPLTVWTRTIFLTYYAWHKWTEGGEGVRVHVGGEISTVSRCTPPLLSMALFSC